MSELFINKTALRKFVREELGCTCDDEVFEAISIVHKPQGEENVDTGYLLKIGGKLLVYLIEPEIQELLAGKLEQIFKWGREMRDKGGYNRFRLVVMTPDVDLLGENLQRHFSTLPKLDERLHLHVIRRDKMPLEAIFRGNTNARD